MAITAVVALLISVFNSLDYFSKWTKFPVRDLAVIAGFLVFMVSVNSLAMLAFRKSWAVVASLPITVMAFACAMNLLGESLQDSAYYALPFTVCWASTLVQLVLLRVNGFRIGYVGER